MHIQQMLGFITKIMGKISSYLTAEGISEFYGKTTYSCVALELCTVFTFHQRVPN